MKIAIVGRGMVGQALGPALERAGHEVAYGVRDAADPRHSGRDLPLKPVGEAAAWAEIIVAAVHWPAIDALLADLGDLSGKVLVDCTNAIDFAGGFRPLVEGNSSAGEEIAKRTSASVVKTLNHVSSEVMASATDYAVRPVQFVAGDDSEAKQKVVKLLGDIGFDARDVGGLELARDLEALARLYIIMSIQGMPRTAGFAFIGPEGKSIG